MKAPDNNMVSKLLPLSILHPILSEIKGLLQNWQEIQSVLCEDWVTSVPNFPSCSNLFFIDNSDRTWFKQLIYIPTNSRAKKMSSLTCTVGSKQARVKDEELTFWFICSEGFSVTPFKFSQYAMSLCYSIWFNLEHWILTLLILI